MNQNNQMPQVPVNMTRHLKAVGIVFIVIGILAVLLPGLASFAVEQMIAWMLVFWGAAGCAMAFSLRGHPEWRGAGLLFVLVLALGMVLALFPGAGIATLTMVLVAIILAEGILSVALGLRLRGRLPKSGWLIFSGACGIALGLMVLSGWSGARTWLLGLMAGLNFLTTGVSLAMISRMARQ